MLFEIVKIYPNRLDDHCLEITLRHRPGFWERVFGYKDCFKHYKGHGQHWYAYPGYQQVPSKVRKLLTSVGEHPEYRHLQLSYKHKKQSSKSLNKQSINQH